MLTLLSSVTVLATNTVVDDSTNENEILATYETNDTFIYSDVYLFETNANLSQVIDGNVYAMGGNLTISGEIYGDLFVMASSLNIVDTAIIHGNIFALTDQFNFSGITSDIYTLSNNFTLEDSGIVARNTYLSATNVSLNCQIGRNSYISTNNLSISSDTEEPIIQGNLYYTSESEFSVPEGSVLGEVTYTPVQIDAGNIVSAIVSNLIMTIIFALVVILLSLWITPKFAEKAGEIIKQKSFLSFGIGLLVFFGTIIISFFLLLFSYGYGFTVAAALIGLLMLIYSISNTVFSMALSKIISTKFNINKSWLYVLISLLIVVILSLINYIPYVGGPITFITSIIGIGIIAVNAYKRKDLIAESKTEK